MLWSITCLETDWGGESPCLAYLMVSRVPELSWLESITAGQVHGSPLAYQCSLSDLDCLRPFREHTLFHDTREQSAVI
jgi:hypothetical protein